MSILSAERSFTQGMAALVDSRHAEAAKHFRSAVQIEEQRSARGPNGQYLSYYGLSLAMAHGQALPAAVDACERALRQDPARPLLLLNLGRVYQLAGLRARALACFQRGLTLAPDHDLLQRHLQQLDRRQTPVVGRLGRCHPLNRWAGRLRAWLGRHGKSLWPWN